MYRTVPIYEYTHPTCWIYTQLCNRNVTERCFFFFLCRIDKSSIAALKSRWVTDHFGSSRYCILNRLLTVLRTTAILIFWLRFWWGFLRTGGISGLSDTHLAWISGRVICPTWSAVIHEESNCTRRLRGEWKCVTLWLRQRISDGRGGSELVECWELVNQENNTRETSKLPGMSGHRW